jgi:hypothetical protein
MGYKDRTWCCEPTCRGKCGRPYFTEEDRKAAEKWWGGKDFPISYLVHEVKDD